jgi:hypothetical protein
VTDDPSRFAARRIPGTAALTLTNLVAGLIVFNLARFNTEFVLSYLGTWAGPSVWGGVLLTSGLFLAGACVTRRWLLLNVGSVLSLFAWTAAALALLGAWLSDTVQLSPIALGLWVWMVAGQAAMLITPLTLRGRDGE